VTGPAIELAGVRRTYANDDLTTTVALADIDLTVPAGRFVSVIGPSGCGKSTLLRMIAGLERAETGTVSVCGVTPEQAAERKLLGFVPQTPALLPWLSVRGNVTLPQKVNRRGARDRPRPDIDALLHKAGLGDVVHARPSQLSGGMRQRTAIVRALALQPDVLLMDEPFSALDEFTREALQDQLLDLWGDLEATVVFVTHSISEAVRLSDTVVVMAPKPGRIVATVDIDLPRPRHEDVLETQAFHDHEIEVRELLRGAFGHGTLGRADGPDDTGVADETGGGAA